MSLEEAIKHCKEKACGNTQCAIEHRQLAEWLEELKKYKRGNKMKAPNKIYLPILPRIENSIISEHCVGTAWDNKEHITIPNIEEYIRKDALLEWAKEKKKQLFEQESENDEPSDVAAGINAGLDMIIGKLNSM